ncbi:Xaa-Pro dipeptidase [Hypericibacter adhaerens]|jgi:imidazolonepropionase-like amidohydrolase|uniref:Xaa-Pro dipeptidase n=1 Tax=Hypericibacter adhaerens TaxID=2602016 RepID=A0A5J6MUH0_9PROT|nr:amidohydrolase family protein [Hypericibacter adhaerens]QEX21049.1 Xaa-Pro dipeptidase [Hypericibacter adhaerens]
MLWITGAQVYDVERGGFSARTVAVSGDRIEAVGDAPPSSDAGKTIDLKGAYLLPGLIDCHVHLTLQSEVTGTAAFGTRDRDRIRQDTIRAAALTLRGGITTVRDCGGWDYIEMGVRDEVEAGRLPGPRMFLSGRLISIETPGAADYPGMYDFAGSAAELKEAAQRQIDRGADFVKIMVTGMFLAPETERAEDCYYETDELSALVRFSHEQGRHVACHAHAVEGVRLAVAAKVDSLEHGTYADKPSLQAMAKAGIYLVPTCTVMSAMIDDADIRKAMPSYLIARYEAARKTHRDAMKTAYDVGVPIVMGTDAGAPGNHHGMNAQECVRMVRDVGMAPQDVLEAATLSGARLLKQEAQLGSIAPGKLADLIATRRNPLEDMTALQDLSLVMKGGAVVRRA